MAKLFQKDEEEAFVALFESKNKEKAIFNDEYIIDCLNMILKYFKNVYIILDNINSQESYGFVKNLIFKMEYFEYSTILLFFRINPYTISSIESIKSFSNKINSLMPDDNSSNQELPPEKYFYSKIKGWTNEDKEQYKKGIKNIINNINNDNTIDYFIFLIKLLYNESFSQNNNLTIFDFNNYLEKFLPLLYISIRKEYFKISINKIQFRTKFIKEIIESQFNFLLSKYLVTDKIFKEIKTKSTEGIYIEREIIFYLITKLIKLDKITIENIYCFDSKIEQKFTKNGIIFIQKLESAPIYDFGIVNIYNGELTFKGYQIGINKPYESLIYLNKEKIRIDLLYFISKINKALNIKITKFTFGIITTINAYKNQINKNIKNDNEFDIDIGMDNYDIYDDNKDNKKEENEKDNEYKNYYLMKNYCHRNNFEFILFDPKDNLFYIDNENKLEKIDFNIYYKKEFENNVTNKFIFPNDNNNYLTKMPLNLFDITIKNDIEYIKSKVNDIKEKKLSFIAKFEIERNIEVINKINFNNLANDNYLIYILDRNNNRTIYYNKKKIVDDCKFFIKFYVFDTSLNKIKNRNPNNKNEIPSNETKKNNAKKGKKSINEKKGKKYNYEKKSKKSINKKIGKKDNENKDNNDFPLLRKKIKRKK